MSLFGNRSFTRAVVAMIIGFFLFFGGNFLMPFYLTQQGLSPKAIGLAMTAFSIVYIPIGLYSGRLSDRMSPRRVARVAMVLAAATSFVFMLALRGGGTWPALAYLVMSAVSYGLFFSPVNHLIINFAGDQNKGSASAIYNTGMAITMALGVALLETVYSEFNVPTQGFTAAFCVAGISCSAATVLLSRKRSAQPGMGTDQPG
jgi:sugar phosphate permease